jgi:hypothetical protein
MMLQPCHAPIVLGIPARLRVMVKRLSYKRSRRRQLQLAMKSGGSLTRGSVRSESLVPSPSSANPTVDRC